MVRLTTSILDFHEDFVPALTLRGEAHLRLGLYDEARSDADHVIKLSQDSVEGRRIRAEVALLTGSPQIAILEAKAAIRVSGNDPMLVAIIEKANAQLSSR